MTRPAPVRLIVAAALTALALTGCSGGGDDTPSGSPSAGGSASSSGAPSTSGSAAPSAVPSSAETSGIDPQNPPEPIASATVPAVSPGESDPKATLTVDLLGLKRQDDLVVATFAFTPSSTDDEADWLYAWLGGQGWSPYLVDTKNLTRHDVVKSKDGVSFASDYQGSKFSSGQTWYAFAAFAAPPTDVTTVDVAAVDGAPAFTEVPIS